MSRWFAILIGGRLDGDEYEIVGTEWTLRFPEPIDIRDMVAALDGMIDSPTADASPLRILDYTYTGYCKREIRGNEIVMVRAYVAPNIKWEGPTSGYVS